MKRVLNTSTKAPYLSGWFNSPFVLMLFLLVFWGSFAGMTKRVIQTMDNYQMQFYIFGIAFIVMTVIFLFNGKLKALTELSGKKIARLALIGLPSYLYYFFYTLSLSKLPATEASIINYLFPVFITLFAIPINGDKVNGIKFASVILGFAGVVVMISNGNFTNLHLTNFFGDILALAGAVSWALFSCFGKKNSTDVLISTYIYTFTGFLLSAISMFVFSGFTVIRGNVAADVVWISISSFVLSYFIWFKMLKSSSTALIASLSFLTPFSTLLFIMLFVGERITIYQFAGLLVILAGTGLQTLFDYIGGRKAAGDGSPIH
jgi:drug/metabolite transporter (DMT)-like permease